MTLTKFLLARIAEDEAVARACAEAFPSPWDVSDRGHSATVVADAPNFWPVAIIGQEQASPGRWPGEHLEHIARHDPARVLAECAAKRRIVDRCSDVGYGVPSTHLAQGVLALLALPYDGHPDYDEAWLR